MSNKKLTDVELFYLDNNLHKTSLAAIAHTLGRTEKFLEKVVKDRTLPVTKNEPEFPNQKLDLSPVTGQPKNTNPNVKNLLARRMKDGKPEGIVAMTEAASAAADDVRPINSARPNRFFNCIHTRPNEKGSDEC